MTETKTNSRAVRDAADALSDLNIFAIIQDIAGGSFLRAKSNTAASRIVKICLAEQQKRLRDYDRAVAKATHPAD